MNVVDLMWPEFLLAAMACVLILMGISAKAATRRLAPILALLTLLVLVALQLSPPASSVTQAAGGTIQIFNFGYYIKLIVSAVGVLLVLLAWPTNEQATGNPALDFGQESGEFFGLMLLSIAGVFLVAEANDLILLFLGVELASIPTYILVSISRPLPVAQEAGVKYFFLGALSAGLMLFGFSYLYGTTGITSMSEIGKQITAGSLSSWQLLGVIMVLVGFAFKIAAVPLHFYVGDVYQGAATPLTAFLAFVPKTSGFVALIKLLWLAGGNSWHVPGTLVTLVWVLAILTMTFGNVLGLLQSNVKRTLAYSSVAHSGYMLAGLAVLLSASQFEHQTPALQGVLFYLAAYGIMNTGAFAVLTLLPARAPLATSNSQLATPPATSAETFEDLAGQGRHHVALGLAMAVACFSLIGIPMTVGFWGKFLLIKPAWLAASEPAISAKMITLVVFIVLNSAVSAGYYLRIIAALFLASDSDGGRDVPMARPLSRVSPEIRPLPIVICLILCMIGTLMLGTLVPTTEGLINRANSAALELEGHTRRVVQSN